MKSLRVYFFCYCFFTVASAMSYAGEPLRVTTCALEDNRQRFLDSVVDVQATMVVGNGHAGFIRDGECNFVFAFGDDYQSFGDRFPARTDEQWKKMRQILSKTECANNVRAVKARFQGTVIRIPATGTIPPSEMGTELVIQSVTDVEPVQIKCTPRLPSK